METRILNAIASIKQQRLVYMANVHACDGAIMALEALLKPETPANESQPDTDAK